MSALRMEGCNLNVPSQIVYGVHVRPSVLLYTPKTHFSLSDVPFLHVYIYAYTTPFNLSSCACKDQQWRRTGTPSLSLTPRRTF